MQIKKYRASTTREALEQIKRELGEEAFVLETKQVRTGGFLGFGSETQIEISAVMPKTNETQTAPKKSTISMTSPKFLRLNENTSAKPSNTSNTAVSNLSNKTNTGSNAVSGKSAPAVLPTVGASNAAVIKETMNKSSHDSSNKIEISPEAPRLVHPKKETPKESGAALVAALSSAAAKPATETANNLSLNPIQNELERLRGELREVKFSLNTFSMRNLAVFNPSKLSFEVPAELYDSPFYEAYLELLATGLQAETARDLICRIIPTYRHLNFRDKFLAANTLLSSIASLVEFSEDPLNSPSQSILTMVGSTGVGKTTTLAKIAARIALRERRRVELVTLDTYRIAAVEQLKTYAEIIGAGCHVARTALELEAILNRLPEDSKVLIDTTGRNPHDLADQLELMDYLRYREDIYKCLVLQATTHPHDAAVAVKKYALYGTNCLTLTKLDETTRPGSCVNIAADSDLPLVYLCAGQRVPEDLELATPESLVAKILPSLQPTAN